MPAALHSQQPDVPACSTTLSQSMILSKPLVSALNLCDKVWLTHIYNIIEKHNNVSSQIEISENVCVQELPDDELMLKDDVVVSWAAYNANISTPVNEQKIAISSLLPLFNEDSKSVAMLRHSMDMILYAVRLLNTGQTPVIAVDQPLFALSKLIQ